MKEIWKDISGYEGYYMVSNLGRTRRIKSGQGSCCSILKDLVSPLGYKRVSLCKNGKPKQFSCHRLVAKAFCLILRICRKLII